MQTPEEQRQNPWETEVYARGRQINRWPHTEIVSRVLRTSPAGDRQAIRVLELGCGTGNNLRFLAEEGFCSFGIDASPTAVAKARELLHSVGLDARIETGEMTSLPWPEEYFDLLIDRAALVHNAPVKIQDVLKESARVLKPAGRIISIGLKSVRHPELRFGSRGKNGAWSEFRHGKFKGLGETSFLCPEEVEGLFSGFEIQNAERLSRMSFNDELLDEEFIVEAIKR